MSFRIRHAIARGLFQAGTLLQALSTAALRPEDLERVALEKYRSARQIERWGSAASLEPGLTNVDRALLDARKPAAAAAAADRPSALVLYSGGGRDALGLATEGFAVTAADALPEMVDALRANAARLGLEVEALVARAAEMESVPGAFDLVWVGCGMYSTIPTRAARIAFLEAAARKLRPGGHVAVSFLLAPKALVSRRANRIRRVFAKVVGGFPDLQRGDTFWRGAEFVHAFASPEELEEEARAAGMVAAALPGADVSDGGYAGALLSPSEPSRR